MTSPSPSPSYGSSLPDSVLPLINPRCTTHLSLLPSLSSFLASLTSLQRQTSDSLSKQVGQFRRQISASAGERSGGMEQQSTLEGVLAGVLEQVDLQVREQGECATRVGREVAEEAEKVGARLEGVRKKHHTHYLKLLSLRDSAYSQRDRSRATYFSSCDTLESARSKKTSAEAGRSLEKATRAYDTAYSEMELAKDQYLLDLSSANVAKSRLYDVELPALEDEYQALEESGVKQLVGLLERMAQLQKESGERVLASVETIARALKGVDTKRDQEEWVRRHEATVLGAFEKPMDLTFEESAVWHDTDAFSTSPPAITYLQNVKQKAQSRVDEMAPEIEAKSREVMGLRNLRQNYESTKGLGDTVGVIENLFTTTHSLFTLAFTSSLLASEVSLIDETLGDDASISLKPHDFKSHSFVAPAICAVCEGSVWGKGLQCKKCGMAVHGKCELKVPAGCASRPGAGVVRAKSKKHGGSSVGSISTPASSSPASSAPPSSTSSFTPRSSVSSLPPPRRSAPFSNSALPPMPSSSSSLSSTATQRATLLYDYTATSELELSVSEGEVVEVLIPEDGSGWVKVRDAEGGEGLVPGSYLEIGAASSGAAAGAGGGAGRARVVALYDYTPQSGDELELREGEEAELVETGADAGEGWTQISKGGRTGIVPSSYIEAI